MFSCPAALRNAYFPNHMSHNQAPTSDNVRMSETEIPRSPWMMGLDPRR